MRLVQRKVIVYGGKTYIYFDASTLTRIRNLTTEELDGLRRQTKRLQDMVMLVLGPSKGMIYTTTLGGRNELILRIYDRVITKEALSLIGWIELQGLETRNP